MRHLESKLQIMCVRWARLQFPVCRRMLFSVPNGYQTSVTQARIAIAEGLVAGVADLILLYPSADGMHFALCIEMKAGKGRQSENQKTWEAKLHPAYLYKVVRTFEEFKQTIEDYLNPPHSESVI